MMSVLSIVWHLSVGIFLCTFGQVSFIGEWVFCGFESRDAARAFFTLKIWFVVEAYFVVTGDAPALWVGVWAVVGVIWVLLVAFGYRAGDEDDV
jgi:hypothetical protein